MDLLLTCDDISTRINDVFILGQPSWLLHGPEVPEERAIIEWQERMVDFFPSDTINCTMRSADAVLSGQLRSVYLTTLSPVIRPSTYPTPCDLSQLLFKLMVTRCTREDSLSLDETLIIFSGSGGSV